MVHRSGSVLPGLLPRGVSPRAAISLAQCMSPFGKALKLAFSPDTHCRAKFTNGIPKLTMCLRRLVILKLRKLSGQLLTARLRHARELPPKAHGRSLNIHRIMLPVDELGYPGEQISRDLVYGMCIFGGEWKRPTPSIRGPYPLRQTWNESKIAFQKGTVPFSKP